MVDYSPKNNKNFGLSDWNVDIRINNHSGAKNETYNLPGNAWYHLVVAYDTSNATADDRIKIYINGTEKFRDYSYAGGTGQYDNSVSFGTYYMNAGDYAEPWSHVNNTPQPTLVGSTTIQISTFGGWLNT